ncbi:MAG: SHOCT domain-containing protein [Clostridia bacterium]|nr:SHOCT domain-containing protein [Clostridia bacterium]
MGFFSPKVKCDVCGRDVGLNRYKIKKDNAWCCPDCLKKAQNGANGKRIVNVMTITVEELKKLVADPEAMGQEKMFKDPEAYAAEQEKIRKTETRKRCEVCGHIFCYTQSDVNENKSNAKIAALSSVGSIAGALSGNYIASAVNNQNANRGIDKIKDFNRCPNCNSTNLTIISDKDFEAMKFQGAQSSISSADELKKFKELLDMGTISQEEFDEKKKQLLGL